MYITNVFISAAVVDSCLVECITWLHVCLVTVTSKPSLVCTIGTVNTGGLELTKITSQNFTAVQGCVIPDWVEPARSSDTFTYVHTESTFYIHVAICMRTHTAYYM